MKIVAPQMQCVVHGKIICFVLLVIFLLAPTLSNSADYLEHVGSLGGAKNGLAFLGDYLYVQEGRYVTALGASVPSNLQKLSRTKIDQLPVGHSWSLDAIGASGDLLFVLGSWRGTEIFSLSDPAFPKLVGALKAGGHPLCIKTRGSLAYIGAAQVYTADMRQGPSGFFICDTSDPTSPSIMGSIITQSPIRDIELMGNKAAILSSFSMVSTDRALIADISDPKDPRIIATIDPMLPGVQSLASSRSILFISYADVILTMNATARAGDGSKTPYGIQIFDTAKGTTASLLAVLQLDDAPNAIAASKDLLAVGLRGVGVRFFDVSKPAAPVAKGLCKTGKHLRNLYLMDCRAWLLYEGDGVEIVDVSDPAKPALIGAYNDPSGLESLQVAGSKIHLAGSAGYQILDAAIPTGPKLLGTLPTTGSAHDVAVQGNRSYVVANGLHAVDFSSPTSPSLLGRSPSNWEGQAVAINGSAVYAGDYNSIRIFDVTNPELPVQVNYFNTSGTIRGILVNGSTLYLAASQAGIYVLHLDSPTSPVLRSRYSPLTETSGLAMKDNLLLVANGNAGLAILDASDSSALSLLGTCDTPGQAQSVCVFGDMACVADGYSGLQLISIANPRSPRILDFCMTDGSARDVAPIGSYLYTAGDGLDIIRLKTTFVPNRADPKEWAAYD